MKKVMSLIVVSALMFVAAMSVASAGGWAVVSLDAMPVGVVVDQPVTVGMVIRQHGQTPWVYDRVQVRGFKETGETFVTKARMDKEGHYTVDLSFPKAGKWDWAVASGLMPEWQQMPPIEVSDSADDEVLLAKANEANRATTPTFELMAPSMLLLGLGVLGLAGSGAGLLMWWRSRK